MLRRNVIIVSINVVDRRNRAANEFSQALKLLGCAMQNGHTRNVMHPSWKLAENGWSFLSVYYLANLRPENNPTRSAHTGAFLSTFPKTSFRDILVYVSDIISRPATRSKTFSLSLFLSRRQIGRNGAHTCDRLWTSL